MFSVPVFKVRFTSHLLLLSMVVLFFILFVRLGFWQVHRAQEKRSMLKQQSIQAKQAGVLWSSSDALPSQYQNIKLKGRYASPLFFLDNQHYRHQFGYDVFSPLLLDDGSIVLIDRGFVLADVTRRTLPAIVTPGQEQILKGSAYFPSTKNWVLGVEIEEKKNNKYVIERIDVKLLHQILQKKVHPFIMRLGKQEAYGFVRDWAIVSMPPDRHIGYAVQWFALALLVFIIGILLVVKKNK